jgi:quercetin dioxygenase-like cupin family protein
MTNFLKIASGVDIMPLLLEVQRQPELWDKNPCRLSKRTPHHETQDMILRYKDETENLERGDWSNFSGAHIPDWYKSIDFLPSAKKLTFDLMAHVRGEILGGVFLYKLNPGTQIYPHKDKGWHPEFYDKFNICLQSNPQAAFCYDGERMIQQAGDIHHFRNDTQHWVVNEGDCEHIVMTVCIRLDRGNRTPWSPEGWTMDKFLSERK